MANDEFYVDESREEGAGGSWHAGGRPPILVGGWEEAPDIIGGSWGGRSPFAPEAAPFRLNRTLSNRLLADADGRILFCRQACQVIPPLVAYISGEDTRGHGRCILLATTDQVRPASSSGWRGHDGTAYTVATVGYWPFGQPGSYRIRAKWQRGHYDYEKIKRAKFIVYGVSTGWVTLALTGWATIATVTVAEDFKLTVNGQPGKRTANKQFLEN